MAKNDHLVVGLDIGTTKTCAIVGEVTDDGISIIGIGSHPSRGLRKGVVVNIESTVHSIQRAVEEAELMDAKGMGVTGGDPLMKIDRTIRYIKTMKNSSQGFSAQDGPALCWKFGD